MVSTSTQESAGIPASVEPMLATPHTGRLPAGSQWAYEDKVDFCTRFESVGGIGTLARPHDAVVFVVRAAALVPRRLRIRWEIRDDIHEAFLSLACAIVCFRRLVNLSLVGSS